MILFLEILPLETLRLKKTGVVLAAFLLLSCADPADPPSEERSAEPAQNSPVEASLVPAFQTNVEKLLAQAMQEVENLPGVSVHVIAPRADLEWSMALGHTDKGKSTPFSSEHPIRISSVTKSFVAAAILRLHEQGKIDLDAPISEYLPRVYVDLVRDGPYEPDAITVRHLLTHTSGLVDVFNTETFQAYFATVLEGGAPKTFTLEEQIRIAVTGGDPTGRPGQKQAYTDTGYLLLGAILETLTGQDMGRATAELSRYDSLDLPNTWWEIFQTPPQGAMDRADQFYGGFLGDDYGPEPFDLYGGGGMISSSSDLARWYWALFHGNVFEQPATLAVMQSLFLPEEYEGEGEELLRHGLQATQLDGQLLFGHSGWWGVAVYYSPQDDVLVAANWLQQHAGTEMTERVKTIVIEATRLSRAMASKI